jgi:hypothetical protein
MPPHSGEVATAAPTNIEALLVVCTSIYIFVRDRCVWIVNLNRIAGKGWCCRIPGTCCCHLSISNHDAVRQLQVPSDPGVDGE